MTGYRDEPKMFRVYPSCCTSAFCGKINCEECRNKPILDEFKKWVKDNNAVCNDPIWCPGVYQSRKGK